VTRRGAGSTTPFGGRDVQVQQVALVAASLLLGAASGFVGLLGGLSRKPRQSNVAAAALLVTAIVLWLLAAWPR
jgi:hypothetical protein